jgi:hypothetical protein
MPTQPTAPDPTGPGWRPNSDRSHQPPPDPHVLRARERQRREDARRARSKQHTTVSRGREIGRLSWMDSSPATIVLIILVHLASH